jgi:hypothetical protein
MHIAATLCCSFVIAASILRAQCGQMIGNVGSRSGFTTQCYRGVPIGKQKARRSGLYSTSFRPRQISAPSAAGTAVTGNGMQNADPASQCMPMNARQWRGANWALSQWVMRIWHRGGIVPTPVAEPQPEDCRFFCKT